MNKYTKSYIILLTSIIFILSSCSASRNVHFAKTTRLLYQEQLRQIDDDKKAEETYNHVLNGAKYKMGADYAMAIIEYQQALQYDSVAVVLSEIAECYNMLAYYGIAAEYATKAIEKDPHLAEAYEQLSSSLMMTYDSKGAIYAYKEYATLVPTDEHIFNLAKMYEISGYPDEALFYYEELSKRNNNPAIIKSMAYIYLGKQDTTRYLELSKEAYKLAPDQQDGIYDMLMCY